jgi:hypothetical protein
VKGCSDLKKDGTDGLRILLAITEHMFDYESTVRDVCSNGWKDFPRILARPNLEGIKNERRKTAMPF